MEHLIQLFSSLPDGAKMAIASVMAAITAGMSSWLLFAKTRSKAAKHDSAAAEHDAATAEQKTKIVHENIKQTTALQGADFWKATADEIAEKYRAENNSLKEDNERLRNENREMERRYTQEKFAHASELAKLDVLLHEQNEREREIESLRATINEYTQRLSSGGVLFRLEKTSLIVVPAGEAKWYPLVEFLTPSSELRIIGESTCFPGAGDEFYYAVIVLVEFWWFRFHEKLTVVVDMPHGTTITWRMMSELLDRMNALVNTAPQKNVVVHWHYYHEDIDTLERGQELAETCSFKFYLEAKKNNDLIFSR